MKQFIFTVLGALLCVPLAAETVSSVSFNPSRLGDYTYLKVSDGANLKGGLQATTLNISSGGSVNVTTDKNTRLYKVDEVTGGENTAIEMDQTVFHGNTASYTKNYNAVNASATGLIQKPVQVKGGKMEFNNDSYIKTMDAVNHLKQKAATLNAGTLTIVGGDNTSLYDGGTTDGFYLAGNDIPRPTANHTNTGSNLTACSLVWEDRRTSDGGSVKLLALQNCAGSIQQKPETKCDESKYAQQKDICLDPLTKQGEVAGTWDSNSCTCVCPSGYNLETTGCHPKSSAGSGTSGGHRWVYKEWDNYRAFYCDDWAGLRSFCSSVSTKPAKSGSCYNPGEEVITGCIDDDQCPARPLYAKLQGYVCE